MLHGSQHVRLGKPLISIRNVSFLPMDERRIALRVSDGGSVDADERYDAIGLVCRRRGYVERVNCPDERESIMANSI